MNFTDLRIIKTQEQLQNALLELLDAKELKEITVKEICGKAGISRNAFYQHYRYKEDLFEQMVEKATERIRNSLVPVIHDESELIREVIDSYAEHIIAEITGVRELIYVMSKHDDGKFLRQLTDLISEQILSNAFSFFHLKDSQEMRLYYEFQAAGMAAFIVKWILSDGVSKDKAASILTAILLQSPGQKPLQL